MTLTKADIVEDLFTQNILSKTQSAQVIDALFDGEPMKLSPRRVVTFNCSRVLRAKMNAESE